MSQSPPQKKSIRAFIWVDYVLPVYLLIYDIITIILFPFLIYILDLDGDLLLPGHYVYPLSKIGILIKLFVVIIFVLVDTIGIIGVIKRSNSFIVLYYLVQTPKFFCYIIWMLNLGTVKSSYIHDGFLLFYYLINTVINAILPPSVCMSSSVLRKVNDKLMLEKEQTMHLV